MYGLDSTATVCKSPKSWQFKTETAHLPTTPAQQVRTVHAHEHEQLIIRRRRGEGFYLTVPVVDFQP